MNMKPYTSAVNAEIENHAGLNLMTRPQRKLLAIWSMPR